MGADDPTEAARPASEQWKRPAVQQAQPKKKGKKRKKTKRRDYDDEDEDDEKAWSDEDESEDQANHGDASRNPDATERARAQARESGKIYKNMVCESVKGMVSTNYKGFTDADLQRRFQLPDNKSNSSLMTEEQVKKLINNKRGVKNSVATASRIEREQQEWQDRLQKHKDMETGVHSNSRFERTCVGRK